MRIRVGISQCLLGEEVRYDGGHKLDRFLRDTLGRYVEFVPVCPEVECGMTVPREALRLVGDAQEPRLMTTKSRQDHTDMLLRWAKGRLEDLAKEDLCGFVLKKRSPSCGMQKVKVYDHEGMPRWRGVGLFARAFMEKFPLIPVEDEGRLHDPGLRENFIERIFTLRRWRDAVSPRRSRGVLVDFHTRQKLLILSHSPQHYREMGKLVANAGKIPTGELFERYQNLLMDALGRKSTARKNTNVLHHVMGYFKKELSSDEKQELLEIIEIYRMEHIPLIVPVTLLNHFVRKYQQPYLRQQTYLNPHPLELQLRNHV
jgi:uncharacterized protein YbgA (DUF1722 family)/uncharacterized protein YbbK (DUF523 family)